jgi:hypothetical protein
VKWFHADIRSVQRTLQQTPERGLRILARHVLPSLGASQRQFISTDYGIQTSAVRPGNSGIGFGITSEATEVD